MAKNFQRKIENFTCKNCGEKVTGDGYTNHCPICLWSKHIDINPGDRSSKCKGLMEPIKIETKKDGYIITHHCEKCGYQKKNKSNPTDNFTTLLQISENNQ